MIRVLNMTALSKVKIQKAADEAGFTPVYNVRNMKEAVQVSIELAKKGDTVLLSPACASWDMYKCFEDRGNDFKSCIKKSVNYSDS